MNFLRVNLTNLVGWLVLGYFVVELVLDVCSGWWRVTVRRELAYEDERTL